MARNSEHPPAASESNCSAICCVGEADRTVLRSMWDELAKAYDTQNDQFRALLAAAKAVLAPNRGLSRQMRATNHRERLDALRAAVEAIEGEKGGTR